MHSGVAPQRGLLLRDVLPDAELVGAEDVRVSSCASDSRACRPGDLFAAIVGERHDGHAFAGEAVARGAVAVLAERPVPAGGAPVCYVPDVRAAFARVCQALAGHPAERLRVVGVTGTNGKTTTSHLIASVLLAAGKWPGLSGTLGYRDGVDARPAPWTTPPANVLADLLARMDANGCTHAVTEVSSHALAQRRVDGVRVDVACVTNVRMDHLDYHGTRARYVAAKSRLLELLAPEGVAILNADDYGSMQCGARYQGPLLTIGIDESAEITATPVEQNAAEQTFLLHAGSETVPVCTRLIGRHNIYNCLVAAAVGLVYGIDLVDVVRGVENVRRMPGRLEPIDCGQPFGVFVDYAHTPDALDSVLSALRAATGGRLICVFGAGGERDRRKRPLMARAVERHADVAVLTTDNPRSERPERIARDVLSGFSARAAVREIPDRAEAIAWAIAQARPGDCVLLAGKGHETVQILGEDRREFDDREVARNWLYAANSIDAMIAGCARS